MSSLPRIGYAPLVQQAQRVAPGTHMAPHGGYDGQFYWAIAIDPLARDPIHTAIDKPTYRYGHPLFAWLGWLLSGGQAGAAADALLVAGLLSLAAAAAAAAALGRRLGLRWAELFTCCNAGLLYSAAHDLAEPLVVALVLGALYAYLEERRTFALVCCALMPLAKEQLVLVPLVLAGWELWQRMPPRRALAFCATLVPSAVWWTYLRIHLGAWFTTGDTALGAPLAGWRRAVLDAGVSSASGVDEATLIVFAALIGLLVVGGIAALRLRSPVDPVYLVFAAVAVCLAPNGVAILRDALRNTALLVSLAPFALGAAVVRR